MFLPELFYDVIILGVLMELNQHQYQYTRQAQSSLTCLKKFKGQRAPCRKTKGTKMKLFWIKLETH